MGEPDADAALVASASECDQRPVAAWDARDALGIFPDGPEKEVLLELVDFSIERAY